MYVPVTATIVESTKITLKIRVNGICIIGKRLGWRSEKYWLGGPIVHH